MLTIVHVATTIILLLTAIIGIQEAINNITHTKARYTISSLVWGNLLAVGLLAPQEAIRAVSIGYTLIGLASSALTAGDWIIYAIRKDLRNKQIWHEQKHKQNSQ